jgi:tRNA A37 methylthiotransferase MiaB
VLKEARALFEGGVKELLVISQDTSAYGVDVKYRTGFWDGKPVKTRMLELVQALGDWPSRMAPGSGCTMCTRTPVWTTSFR